jgi:hypothetical protein
VLAAAAVHGGTEPDLLDEVAWWQTDDFWQYAMFEAVACIRAAASRAGVPMRHSVADADLRCGARSPSLSAARLAGHVSAHGQRYRSLRSIRPVSATLMGMAPCDHRRSRRRIDG